MNNNKQLLLHLSLIPNVGPGILEKLINQFSESSELPDFYSFRVSDFGQFGVAPKVAQKLVDGLKDFHYLTQELDLIEKHDIHWITRFDHEYPELLKTIHLPPVVLYVQGSLQHCNQAIAFVGSRAKSSYGKQVVQTLVPQLVASGYTIVSGGAYGIDTLSHEAAVKSGGKTIVVLGSGLLKPYPSTNKKLFESVVYEGGAVVSTFPLTMAALPQHFPARNRVIAGLSKGVVVVRAAAKSGSLITGDYALQQGRFVFAIPGPIDDPLSAGCHALIKQGATLVDSADAIFEEFGVGQNRSIITEPDFKQEVIVDPLVNLCRKAKTVGELLEATGFEENKLNERLFELQLSGVLQQNFAGLWETV
jgi:DNA processing protein